MTSYLVETIYFIKDGYWLKLTTWLKPGYLVETSYLIKAGYWLRLVTPLRLITSSLLGAGQGMFFLPTSRGLPTCALGKAGGLCRDSTYNGAGVDVVRVAVAVFRLQQDPGVVIYKGAEQRVRSVPAREGPEAVLCRRCPLRVLSPSRRAQGALPLLPTYSHRRL